MLALSILAISALAITTLLELDPDVKVIFNVADYIVCFLFFIDFLYSLWKAERKLKYLYTWGWLDLLPAYQWWISSVGAELPESYGSSVRFERSESAKILSQLILKRRAESAFLAVALISFLLLIIGSTAILQFEKHHENANIRTAEDALWWAAVTITTVGYGDKFPVTTDGRIIACVLMVGGVGLFGTFSGFVASWFLAESKRKNAEPT